MEPAVSSRGSAVAATHQSAGFAVIKGGCARTNPTEIHAKQFNFLCTTSFHFENKGFYVVLVHHMVHSVHRILGDYSNKTFGVLIDLG